MVVMLRLNLPGEHFEPTSSVMFEAPPEGRAMVVGLKVARTQLGIPETERVSTSESPWNGKTVTVAEAVKPLAPMRWVGRHGHCQTSEYQGESYAANYCGVRSPDRDIEGLRGAELSSDEC